MMRNNVCITLYRSCFFYITKKSPPAKNQVLRCIIVISWSQRVLTRSPDTLTEEAPLAPGGGYQTTSKEPDRAVPAGAGAALTNGTSTRWSSTRGR